MNKKGINSKCFCNLSKSEFKKFTHKIFEYKKPPKGEIQINLKQKYYRKYLKCEHIFGQHNLDLHNLYNKEYINKTYGGYKSLIKKFNKISLLKNKDSDNYFRVKRILNILSGKKKFEVCDVGSGLGIFPYQLRKKLNCNITLIETDDTNLDFLKKYLNFKNVFKSNGFFKEVSKKKYDLITFNKVLEHIEKPTLFLKKFSKILKKDGLIYIEVPDVLAAKNSFFREEFFIEHHHIFSFLSLYKLVKKTNLQIKMIERIREPSGKYTIFCFCNFK